ncbi:uncharacterized protein KY384_008339 [Bacidia gigantensis]|uniref:uncharacterized protein n=1 Tax=Bacidia gigantensis TaxID=2732470 RepID=UPI001D051860|nr:uncharacterized protein KY384_008339 [Bacidia gigantensis]KAG8526910.1 hypothetical protein KY384_008339 [Bacidia gigantensis]
MIHLKSQIPHNDIQRVIASWGRPDTITANQSHYPTDFSRDIHPIPCHSHNDYDRRVPLYDALAAGCLSVEADVWYSPRDLLVGHSLNSLTQSRTLQSMYIDPLISILSHQNPKTIDGVETNTSSLHGIFDESPSTPLILLIDVKTDGAKTFPFVANALEPFRSRGWLTHYNGSAVIPGLITVVGTGNTPFNLLTANTTYRDIFFDAPLADLWGEDAPADASHLYDATNSYYASTDFDKAVGKLWHGMLAPLQVERIRGQVGEAQKKG